MNAVFEVLVNSFYLLISSMGYIAMIQKRIDFIQMIFQFNNNKVYWISYKYVYSKGFFFFCADLFLSKTLVISGSKKIH